MSSKIYLYRRKGNSEWATCDQSRFVEFSSHKLFDTKTCYEDAPELAELQATVARLREEVKTLRNTSVKEEVFDIVCKERDQFKAEIERLKGGQGEPVAEIANKYGDPEAFAERELRALVDIQKLPCNTMLYTSQPAPVSVPDGWKLVPLHPTMDMLDALMEWNKVGNVNAYNNILEAAPACLDKVKELNQ